MTTREQFKGAVDVAHAALHVWESQAGPGHPLHGAVTRAHEALHSVGAGTPHVDCATPDPEAQRLYAELRARTQTPMACGHKLEDLVAGANTVTFCGACQVAKKAGKPYGVVTATDLGLAAVRDMA